jgi:hypothetical protein
MISISAPLRNIALTLFALAFVTALAVAPVFFGADANAGSASTESAQTQSQDPRYPNYDIRTDKHAFEKMASIRSRSGHNAPEVADIRAEFVSAKQSSAHRYRR